jgi:hypothetical protein
VAAEQRDPPRAGGGQDRPHVVHLVLERVPALPAVGQAAAGPVEQDQPGERRELVEKGRERRVLPHEPEVAGPAEEEDEVEVALSDHLVGDAAAVLTAGVPERRAIAHGQSLRAGLRR